MNYSLAILTTEINKDVISAMLESAGDEASRLNADITQIVATAGCLDMPVVAKHLLKNEKIDGLVVLGAVALGETKHDELVVNTMTAAIVDLSVTFDKPVGFGVIGPGAPPEKFMARTDEYARRAVQAVVTNIDILRAS